MKTQKATKVYGTYAYEVAIAENGKVFSRMFVNGKNTKWEAVPTDIDATRNMPLQPAPYKCRLPMA